MRSDDTLSTTRSPVELLSHIYVRWELGGAFMRYVELPPQGLSFDRHCLHTICECSSCASCTHLCIACARASRRQCCLLTLCCPQEGVPCVCDMYTTFSIYPTHVCIRLLRGVAGVRNGLMSPPSALGSQETRKSLFSHSCVPRISCSDPHELTTLRRRLAPPPRSLCA